MTTPDQPEPQPTTRTRPCGARVCGMHPEHPWTGEDGQPLHCPGDLT